jgi:hypothetical protein
MVLILGAPLAALPQPSTPPPQTFQTKDDVECITKWMYEQSAARAKLGMKSREIAKSSFSGEKYLRGHEQNIWIGKAKKDMTLWVYKRPSGEWIPLLQ